MTKNHCDYVVANDLRDIKNGEHKALLLNNDGNVKEMNGKEEIAETISQIIR